MTARPSLTNMQARELQAAKKLLADGKGEGAMGRIRPLLAGGLVHADVYALFASACRMQGLMAEARTSLNAAINLDHDNAVFWAALADLLEASGDRTSLVVALQRLMHLKPDDIGCALKLGELLLRDGDTDRAASVLHHALAVDAGSLRAAHALAVALRMLDRCEEALMVLAPFAGARDTHAETIALNGHILGDLGRFDEALGHYRAALIVSPAMIDTHETLARLLPQLGQSDAAMDGYRTALAARPADATLWASALASARSLGQVDHLLAWSDQAAKRFPERADFTVFRADALGLAGDIRQALSLLEPLASGPNADPVAAIQSAHWRLASGDPAFAERHAQTAVNLAPDIQTGWAYLGTCWRLLGDKRDTWLNDYDRLTSTLILEPPEGFANLTAFLMELRETLDALHVTMEHPADQSLRHGTQTRGHLFMRRNVLIEALGLGLHRQIEAWLATLPDDPTHPFLRRNSRRIGFKHSWSVKLRNNGFHQSHIHHDGWLSSAFYVALPQDLSSGTAEGGLPQGALTLGVPDRSLGLDLAPQRVVQPEPGMLVLFPSYIWHGTVQFSSAQPRMTVAFDALPS